MSKIFFPELENILIFNNISEFNDFFKQIISNYLDISDVNDKAEYYNQMHKYIINCRRLYRLNPMDMYKYLNIVKNLEQYNNILIEDINK